MVRRILRDDLQCIHRQAVARLSHGDPGHLNTKEGMNMKKTYIVSVQGTPETAERAVKLLDRVFRWRYNVHGVYRERSAYDAVVDTLTIDVLLTADWMDSPRMQYLFPEYSVEGIRKTWYYLMNREHALDDVVVGHIVEVQARA